SRLRTVDTSQEFDVVVVQLSTNDASKKIELGTISESKNTEDFDTQTVIGSMEAIICYGEETWGCPVVFYTGTKYDSVEYEAMVNGLLQLQEKWDIGVIDLWNDEEMNAVSKTDYALYMNDDIHPTQAGYLLWWTPKFQEYLYEYLAE
ncbi:MAG: SGNH/GDSL hydrolase family protein, partial [Agathobacter sp.]|nr:SGNH/GDSL hydrolase family protein [Agathobacter sp.]